MNGLLELLGPLIADVIRRDFEEEEVRAVYMGPSIRVFVHDDYIELVKGAEYNIPRWLARLLYEKKLVKEYDKPVDEVALARINFNESRSRGQLKFERLQGYFYNKVLDQIDLMIKMYKEETDLGKVSQIVKSIQDMSNALKSIYRTRLNKLFSIVNMEVASDMLADLSEEEKQLYNSLRTLLKIFGGQVMGVEKHGRS